MTTTRPVLISGASSGIGKASALHLAARGFFVIAGVRREQDGQQLESASQGRLYPMSLDTALPNTLPVASLSAYPPLMIEIPPSVVAEIQQQVFSTYPSECCGLLFARQGSTRVSRCMPLQNLADKYHALDPLEYPRTSRDAFMVNEAALAKLVREAEAAGETWLGMYHSHIDCGAYFSAEDRKFAAPDGVPVYPDLFQVVIEAHAGRIVEARAFRWDGKDYAHHQTFPEFASNRH